MLNNLKITSAQINYKLGDISGNREKILAAYNKACADKDDLIIFSELAITGYPPEDLILRKKFQHIAIESLEKIAKATNKQTAIIIGGLWQDCDYLYNSGFLLYDGKIKHIQHKNILPNYGVFDEKRLFTRGKDIKSFKFKDHNIAITICEDIWDNRLTDSLKKQELDLLVSINASPFDETKLASRISIVSSCAKKLNTPIIYVNQVGGQDELVFDGGSFALDSQGKLFFIQELWQESVKLVSNNINEYNDRLANIYEAVKLGLHDYITKNNFPGVVIGMSGGIDSALSATIAADALGAEKVRLIMMPSEFTSIESKKDAQECADLLGIELEEITIDNVFTSTKQALETSFTGKDNDTTEENIQSRIRGMILMAISNKFGHMVLTTGNKSEMAVGYATLYGDMCGGFNALKDIYKSDVFALAKWRNELNYVIPNNIITKSPTAELREDQKDEDSLPPYDILDDILHKLIDLKQSTDKIIESGHDKETVHKIAKLVLISEYKRRQAPPGVKITSLSFGKDRRYPITNGYKF